MLGNGYLFISWSQFAKIGYWDYDIAASALFFLASHPQSFILSGGFDKTNLMYTTTDL